MPNIAFEVKLRAQCSAAKVAVQRAEHCVTSEHRKQPMVHLWKTSVTHSLLYTVDKFQGGGCDAKIDLTLVSFWWDTFILRLMQHYVHCEGCNTLQFEECSEVKCAVWRM